MKNYHTLMSELSESTAVTFGEPLRASGTLEGKSVTLDILRGAEEIGTIRAINYLSAVKGESAFASQMKKLQDELKQLVQLGGMDKSPAEVANMAVHGMARLNKIRSMLEQA